jgi:hypothetical protein
MRRDLPDFFLIAESQQAIHMRLENWARYVAVRHPNWISPMWKQGKSNGRQWHAPEVKAEVDTLDGHALEKAVSGLPWAHRDSLRWFYVHKTNPHWPRKALGVTDGGLQDLVKAGRQMLINRRA